MNCYSHVRALPCPQDYDYSYGPEAGWNVQRDGIIDMLVPRLPGAHQRAVPTSQGFFVGLDTTNATQVARIDDYCVHNAEATYAWARTHPKVGALLAFFWNAAPLACVGPPPAKPCVSLMALPKCTATWIKIGKEVVARASAAAAAPAHNSAQHSAVSTRGTTTTTTTRASSAKPSCPTPIEHVQHKWCRWTDEAFAERVAARELLKGRWMELMDLR